MQLNWVLFFLLVGVTPVGEGAKRNEYCKSEFACGELKKHFMCKYRKKLDEEHCQEFSIATTPSWRKRLLGSLNGHRNRVASGWKAFSPGATWPGAANMRQLVWSSELEELAVVAATNSEDALSLYFLSFAMVSDILCTSTSDFPRGTGMLPFGPIQDLNAFYLGLFLVQRIQIPPAVIEEFPSLIPDEVRIRQGFPNIPGIPSIPGFPDPSIPNIPGLPGNITKLISKSSFALHTTLIWAETYKVGCSVLRAKCNPVDAVDAAPDKFLGFCFLGPRGNVQGEPVFKAGPKCSDCPLGSSCKRSSTWPYLCARPEDPEQSVDIDEAVSLPTPAHHVLLLPTGVLISTLRERII